jgi:hypothetical protein
MGVDYGGRGNLYALGDGVIVNVNNVGWPGGRFLCIHLSNGLYVYYAEDLTPYVKVGQKVTAGQRIAFATGGSAGVEIGWAAPPGKGITMAAATGQNAKGLAAGDPGRYPTAFGVSMSNLIASLGGPPGTASGPIQGKVPANYPAGGTVTTAVITKTAPTGPSDETMAAGAIGTIVGVGLSLLIMAALVFVLGLVVVKAVL